MAAQRLDEMDEELCVALGKAGEALQAMRDLVHRRTPVVAGVVEPLDRDAAVDLILPVVARLADADRARVGGEPIPVAVVARGPPGAEDHREASALDRKSTRLNSSHSCATR